jgi:Zn-dependent peptidase ImmA (M78 family)
MDRQEFYYNALLSYQELHNNYFPEIENEVKALKKSYSEEISLEVKSKVLRKILLSRFGITVDRKTIKHFKELMDLRSLYLPAEKVLMLNQGLTKAQTNFLLGKEIGFQMLGSEDRPFETPPQYDITFEETLNNFRASYFSSALLIDEEELIKDTKDFLSRESWDPDIFLSLLDKYNSTPEMIFQRMTNVLPKVLGINNLFFMRFVSGLDLKEMVMTKELRISSNPETHVRKLNEHYCRRWIGVSGLKKAQSLKLYPDKDILVDAQVSVNFTTKSEFFCISIAFPNVSNDTENISVTIGFLIDNNLKKHISFLNDPKLKRKEVNITCERCAVTDCNDRVSPPIVLLKNKQKEEIRKSIDQIMK